MARNVQLAFGYSAQVGNTFLPIILNIVATLNAAQPYETSCFKLSEYCKMWPKASSNDSEWICHETISIYVKHVMMNLFLQT